MELLEPGSIENGHEAGGAYGDWLAEQQQEVIVLSCRMPTTVFAFCRSRGAARIPVERDFRPPLRDLARFRNATRH